MEMRRFDYEEIKRGLFDETARQAARLVRKGLDYRRRLEETEDSEEHRHLKFVLNLTLARLATHFRVLAAVTGNGAHAVATDINRLLDNETFDPVDAADLLERAERYLREHAGDLF